MILEKEDPEFKTELVEYNEGEGITMLPDCISFIGVQNWRACCSYIQKWKMCTFSWGSLITLMDFPLIIINIPLKEASMNDELPWFYKKVTCV